ncbi:MAG: hypothetical protein U0O22_04485 [Acutalibacteraceae bacterium]
MKNPYIAPLANADDIVTDYDVVTASGVTTATGTQEGLTPGFGAGGSDDDNGDFFG